MTEIGRVSGVFFEPGKVFADLAERPRWVVPMVIAIIFGLAFSYCMSTRIGWDQTIRQAMEKNPRTADMPAAQKEQAIAQGAKVGGVVGWAVAIIGPPLFTMIVAGVLTGLFNALLGTDLKFKQIFSITAYAFLIRGIFSLLLILIMYLKPPEEFDLTVSPFSPAAYISRTDTPRWLFSLLGSLDLFTIWTILVLAVGISVASKKLSFGKSLTAILVPWVLVVVATMATQAF